MNVTTAQVRKAIHAAPTYVVFAAAAYQSFGHSYDVAKGHGSADPWLLPVSIDGVLIVAARYVSHGRTCAARGLAFAVMGLAMLATLGVNALAAPTGDLIGLGVAVWPAAAMILTASLIHWAPQKPKAVVRRRPAARKNVTSITKARKTA
jgi:hypothetical protein